MALAILCAHDSQGIARRMASELIQQMLESTTHKQTINGTSNCSAALQRPLCPTLNVAIEMPANRRQTHNRENP